MTLPVIAQFFLNQPSMYEFQQIIEFLVLLKRFFDTSIVVVSRKCLAIICQRKCHIIRNFYAKLDEFIVFHCLVSGQEQSASFEFGAMSCELCTSEAQRVILIKYTVISRERCCEMYPIACNVSSNLHETQWNHVLFTSEKLPRHYLFFWNFSKFYNSLEQF